MIVLHCCLQRSRAALQRYLFYCNRYMNHMQSLRFENKVSRVHCSCSYSCSVGLAMEAEAGMRIHSQR